MKKWISILLLSLYLVSTTELNQVLKLPVLIEHYNEHHKLNPEMSLLAFFKAHYDHPAKDSDYKKDSKLPFVRHSTISLVFTLSPDFKFEVMTNHYQTYKVHQFAAFDDTFFVKGYLNSVWQPPRQS